MTGQSISETETQDLSSLFPEIPFYGKRELLKIEKFSLNHPGNQNHLLFHSLDLTLYPKDVIAIIAPNGKGKTTLFKALNQQYPSLSGKVTVHPESQISYFDQHRAQFDPKLTVKDILCPKGDYVYFNNSYMHHMSFFERFLFDKYSIRKEWGTLSGGEKARVYLASILLENSQILFLDEPTNDLDIPTLQLLEYSIQNFQGSILFTSHDRYFIQRVATKILVWAGEKIIQNQKQDQWIMVADLNQAMQVLEETKENQMLIKSPEKIQQEKSYSEQKELKSLLSKKKKEKEKIEEQMKKIEKTIEKTHEEMEKAFSGNAHEQSKGQKLSLELKNLEKNLEDLMEKWYLLEEEMTPTSP